MRHSAALNLIILSATATFYITAPVKRVNKQFSKMDSYEFLTPLAIFGGLAFFWYIILKYITEYLLKKKMIDKGYVNEENQALFKQQEGSTNMYSALKWGLILLCGGIALILLEYIPYERDSPLPFGVFIVFVAAGFLIYFKMMKKEAE